MFFRDWPAQAVPFYAITVRSDGSGFLTTQRGAAEVKGGAGEGPGAAPDGSGPDGAAAGGTVAGGASGSGTADGGTVAGGTVGGGTVGSGMRALGDKDPSGPLQISEAVRAKLFAVRPVLASGKGCEASNKHTAQTGTKTLVLRDGGGELRCSFNRSDDKRVEEAMGLFAGIETTMEEGPKLRYLRRYDRLGLDAELGTFLMLAKDGRAIEIGNVAPVLRTLAGDGELMDRVRNRASDLLAMAEAGK